MMEQRISIITLGVSDLQRSKAFYDTFGWQAVKDEQSGEIVAYDLLGMTLCLYAWEKLAEDAGVSPERSGYSAISLAYNVPSEAEVDQTLALVKTAGGTLIKAAQKAFWGGYSGYFADPDGQLWEVAMNPFAPLGSQGEFQWHGASQE